MTDPFADAPVQSAPVNPLDALEVATALAEQFIPDMGANPMEMDPITKNALVPGETVVSGMPEGIAEHLTGRGSAAVYHAIQDASNNTERSQQKELGASALGHCRRFAQFVLDGEAPSDERDKTAAWVGTVLGDAIETQLAKDHPDWLFQQTTGYTFANGVFIPGHTDVVVPASAGVSIEEFMAQFEDGYDGPDLWIQGVKDLKSKDKLGVVKQYGQTQQQIYQLHTYTAGLIQKGVLDGSKPIWIEDNYYDRSGKEQEVYTVGHWYNPNVIEFINEWLDDVLYAQQHGSEAPKDMPREWCMNWCEYATTCRGADTDVQGLINDPLTIAAVSAYKKGLALEKAGKAMKDAAKPHLENVEGSTGDFMVRWTITAGGEVSYYRKESKKLSIVPVKAVKPPAIRKPRKKKEVEA